MACYSINPFPGGEGGSASYAARRPAPKVWPGDTREQSAICILGIRSTRTSCKSQRRSQSRRLRAIRRTPFEHPHVHESVHRRSTELRIGPRRSRPQSVQRSSEPGCVPGIRLRRCIPVSRRTSPGTRGFHRCRDNGSRSRNTRRESDPVRHEQCCGCATTKRIEEGPTAGSANLLAIAPARES